MDQIVENNRRAELSVATHVGAAVLKDHEARGLGWIILFGNVDPVIAHRAGKDFAFPAVLCYLASGHVFLDHGILPKFVIVRGAEREDSRDENERYYAPNRTKEVDNASRVPLF